MKLLSFLLVALLSFESCSSKNKTTTAEPEFAKGKIINNVECRFENTQTYALYLPSNYSKNKKYPIIYAFDSHGCGLLPVELFKDDAEKYGYIVVGSNNSKNGTAWNATSAIYDTLHNDTHRRFSIDNNRIYTAGFSGGSRVASGIAITKGGVNTVIGCGAGLGANEQPKQKFSYYGIAGNADMNYTEMVSLDSMLEKSGFRHYFQSFDGKHAWPTKHIINEAVLWLELNAIRENLCSKNDTLINNSFRRLTDEHSINSNKNNIFQAYLVCNKIINYYDGLVDISKFKTEKLKLEQNAIVLQTKKHLLEIGKQEVEKQAFYSKALSSQAIDWWKSQVSAINQKIKTSKDKEEQQMLQRVLNYLSLACYMNTNGALKSNNLEYTAKFNTIYAMVDPENSEHAYIAAILSMKNNKTDDAISHLQEAVSLGFSDINRLEKDSEFEILRRSSNYVTIINSIKNKKL